MEFGSLMTIYSKQGGCWLPALCKLHQRPVLGETDFHAQPFLLLPGLDGKPILVRSVRCRTSKLGLQAQSYKAACRMHVHQNTNFMMPMPTSQERMMPGSALARTFDREYSDARWMHSTFDSSQRSNTGHLQDLGTPA